jgi:spermidine/putrescine transport system substrate-binding protein
MVMEHSENLSFFVPQEGTNIWVDYFTLGAKAKRVDLAYAFLNYINEPSVAAKMASYTHYATPNHAAKALLPKELLDNPLIYPPKEVLSRSEFYQPPTQRQSLSRQRISSQILMD